MTLRQAIQTKLIKSATKAQIQQHQQDSSSLKKPMFKNLQFQSLNTSQSRGQIKKDSTIISKSPELKSEDPLQSCLVRVKELLNQSRGSKANLSMNNKVPLPVEFKSQENSSPYQLFRNKKSLISNASNYSNGKDKASTRQFINNSNANIYSCTNNPQIAINSQRQKANQVNHNYIRFTYKRPVSTQRNQSKSGGSEFGDQYSNGGDSNRQSIESYRKSNQLLKMMRSYTPGITKSTSNDNLPKRKSQNIQRKIPSFASNRSMENLLNNNIKNNIQTQQFQTLINQVKIELKLNNNQAVKNLKQVNQLQLQERTSSITEDIPVDNTTFAKQKSLNQAVPIYFASQKNTVNQHFKRKILDDHILQKLNADDSVKSLESAELAQTCEDEKQFEQKKPIQSLKVFKLMNDNNKSSNMNLQTQSIANSSQTTPSQSHNSGVHHVQIDLLQGTFKKTSMTKVQNNKIDIVSNFSPILKQEKNNTADVSTLYAPTKHNQKLQLQSQKSQNQSDSVQIKQQQQQQQDGHSFLIAPSLNSEFSYHTKFYKPNLNINFQSKQCEQIQQQNEYANFSPKCYNQDISTIENSQVVNGNTSKNHVPTRLSGYVSFGQLLKNQSLADKDLSFKNSSFINMNDPYGFGSIMNKIDTINKDSQGDLSSEVIHFRADESTYNDDLRNSQMRVFQQSSFFNREKLESLEVILSANGDDDRNIETQKICLNQQLSSRQHINQKILQNSTIVVKKSQQIRPASSVQEYNSKIIKNTKVGKVKSLRKLQSLEVSQNQSQLGQYHNNARTDMVKMNNNSSISVFKSQSQLWLNNGRPENGFN
ncbi:UNKNOWN [Stylonychia lemnae]|uniref:Uncharacterized protein n=1 Tax=Stylonychia lemnae TaxID=5949 RepID=A0A077ZVY7_STYLE|nr:UNKNOWN [Stylonychia lemnae]|eukprot:CDW73756.1 UNKNOWN [Stylonychia lemnae]